MPIFDFYCETCGFTEDDVLVRNDEDHACKMCDNEKMTKKMPSFSFSFTPPGVSKFKKKYGKSVPQDYKTTGGANVYGKPKKRK